MPSGSIGDGVAPDGRAFEVGDELVGRQTILDALRVAVAPAEVGYAPGTGIVGGTDDDFAEAVELAREADIAIVVLGERSGLTDDSTTGEFRDRVGLGFMGRQQELLEAVVATGTPVVLVVVSGRPLALPWAEAHCAAILLAWVPGDAGPSAIADAVTGKVNPAANCRSRCRAMSARCRSRTDTTRPAAARIPRGTTSIRRSRRSGPSDSVGRIRPSPSTTSGSIDRCSTRTETR